MKLVEDKISIGELEKMAEGMFGDFVKAVVDIKKEIVVMDGELHADEEMLLLKNGSKQGDLWGINIYPKVKDADWIEFDSMINLRPSFPNMTRGVDDPKIRKKIIKIIDKLVEK